jgi:hypothetical protein
MGSGQGARERLGGACGLLLVSVLILLLAKSLYPADLPESRNPDFVDNVFDNRGVLWAARLVLVSAAGVLAVGGIFIVASVGIRMRNREWLRRAGPFEVSEGTLEQVKEEAEYWRRAALASEEEGLHLRARLRKSEDLLAEAKAVP